MCLNRPHLSQSLKTRMMRSTVARTSVFSSLSPPYFPHSSSSSSSSLPLRFRLKARNLRCSSTALNTKPLLEKQEQEDDSNDDDDDLCSDTVEQILSPKNKDKISTLMKMERRRTSSSSSSSSVNQGRWFPYLDRFRTVDGGFLTSEEVVETIEPCILDSRKERFKSVAMNRSYGVCLVVEGLTDFGNVSAAFRSADALGFQSVHVVSCDASKRFRENRHISMGSEKWLDIEAWNSSRECFTVLKSRGYRIATAHLGKDTVSIYDMDWSCPTAIVVGNENSGVSEEALALSDLHCSIPMNGMVDSFNVSVAAGILMHQAVRDRISRLGSHGDLTPKERQILLAEFYLRHSKTAVSVAHEYANRRPSFPTSKL